MCRRRRSRWKSASRRNIESQSAMSHLKIVLSPAGTPTPDRTVGEMVAELPARSRVFQEHGIDFCCQGGRTVREACERKGVALERIVSALEAVSAESTQPEGNPAELPPGELAVYIVDHFHEPLRRELPRLRAMAQRVAQVHGSHTPSLREVLEVFLGLEAELTSHLLKEEQVLFPAIAAIESGYDGQMHLDGPIACMFHEHEDAGAALVRLRELTGGFVPPADACNTYRALFSGLAELEDSLHRHIHLENSVLFPAARGLAAAGPQVGSRLALSAL